MSRDYRRFPLSSRVQVECGGCDTSTPLRQRTRRAGPYEGEGNHDILFNNEGCVVVEPGIVEEIMKHMKLVAEYPREGNLYLSEFTMSGFARQDQES